MFSICVFASLALVPFISAQSSDPSLDIKAIQAHFQGSGITPSLLSAFDPSAVLSVTYGATAITPGQALTKDQAAPTPALSVTPANSSVTFTGTYTVAMVDAGPVGTDTSQGVTRHWLVNGVTIANNKVVIPAAAVNITQYAGPAPPAGSGPHRYVILLYSQPSTFVAPAEFSEPNMGVSVFNFGSYVQGSGLGALVAGNYITVEEGTATASLSATSAVVSSTLAPGSPTKTAGASPTGTGAGSSTGASPSAKPSSGAVGSVTAASPLLVLTGFLVFNFA